MLTQPKQFDDCQRVQVSHCTEGPEKLVKITIERYNHNLGWYTAGALSIPLHQLPLLQQALESTNIVSDCDQCTASTCANKALSSKIIPFPTLGSETVAEINKAEVV